MTTFRYIMKFTRAACWINSKINNRDKNTTLMIFLLYHYCWSLLWRNYWRSLMVWNSISWSRLKLVVQTQFNFYSCYPFLINNCNMAGSSVEKYKFFVLNVKLVVKLRFKRFYLLENLLSTTFALYTTTNTVCPTSNFSIS